LNQKLLYMKGERSDNVSLSHYNEHYHTICAFVNAKIIKPVVIIINFKNQSTKNCSKLRQLQLFIKLTGFFCEILIVVVCMLIVLMPSHNLPYSSPMPGGSGMMASNSISKTARLVCYCYIKIVIFNSSRVFVGTSYHIDLPSFCIILFAS
jgi:hypothetical protein